MTSTSTSARVRRGLAMALLGVLAVPAAAVPADASTVGNGAHLRAWMTGEKEVLPNVGDPDGFGRARVHVKGDRVCFSVSWNNIDAPTAAHIHAGAVDANGPVVVPLLDAPGGVGGAVSRVGGCAVNAVVADGLRADPRAYYVNVHNAAYPGGAIRGQLHR